MTEKQTSEKGKAPASAPDASTAPPAPAKPQSPTEVGGRPGPDPTRYGDWEVKGICSDF